MKIKKGKKVIVMTANAGPLQFEGKVLDDRSVFGRQEYLVEGTVKRWVTAKNVTSI